jgi:hypothetical protein
MSYKPNFCCQCGEKIERVEWFLKSRRFCELCATEFGFHDKIPWILVGAAVLFGLVGVGTYFRTPEKALNLAPNNLVVQNTNKSETIRSVSSSNLPTAGAQQNPAGNSTPTKTEALPAAQNSKAEKESEAVYICGAPTKKGTPCSRRVKGGGRCWQHLGQAAMLPQEKLRISN